MDTGRLELDAPIQRYVPTFPENPGGAVTPRLLAANLAGIRHWRDERTPALYATHFDDVADPTTYAESREVLRVPEWDYSHNLGGGSMYSTAVLSNSWGVGARSAELVSDLPERLASICYGQPAG